ncbi:MAG: hypothetical protein Udaeo2_23770 [Candidatus Udaeobacter sp.]|nr:MAG: hypothetical protein Udaeo2_23770 [Candidatus Udaeobacter sp.]
MAKTATIMITFKNFNLSRLLSQQVAPVCLGGELQGSNVFLDFFGCVSHANRGTVGRYQSCSDAPGLFFNDYRCVVTHEIK